MEDELLIMLGEVWNAYIKRFGHQKTPKHSDDTTDFRKCIHDAQRIIITRTFIDALEKKKRNQDNATH